MEFVFCACPWLPLMATSAMNAATMNTLVPFAIVCSYLPWARGLCAVFARVCLVRLLMRLGTQ